MNNMNKDQSMAVWASSPIRNSYASLLLLLA